MTGRNSQISRQPQSGFVSLITAIMISLLLIVITVSMVTMEVAQLRKSADAEQAVRANYTAEAGVEDAINRVLNGTLTTDQTCTDASGATIAGSNNTHYDDPGAAGWTCQQIAFSGKPTGVLERPDVTRTVDPGPAAAFQQILVEWDQTLNPDVNYYTDPLPPLPDQASFNKVPPVELTVIEFPQAAVKVGVSDFCTPGKTPYNSSCKVLMQNVLLLPRGTLPGAGSAVYGGAFTSGGPLKSKCWQGRAEYRCEELLTGFDSTKDYVFRIRSRYGGSAYRFTFQDNSGVAVPVPDGTATIDVTAKAGQSFRRTITKVPLNNGAASGLDYVIFSDTGVCKQFTIVNNVFPGSTCAP